MGWGFRRGVQPDAKGKVQMKAIIHCSFCGKSNHEVKKIIAGPDVYICDECVFLSMDVLIDDDAKARKAALRTLKVA